MKGIIADFAKYASGFFLLSDLEAANPFDSARQFPNSTHEKWTCIIAARLAVARANHIAR
ncbi:MAG TPA: hypothetical protein VKY22_12270 [Bradyrhizobium sp.]|nr:hypothetical protein [Bradyrhizobium sp.]